MALVGAPGSNRLAAVLILVIVLLLVYLVGFHWFLLRHLEYGEEIAGLSEQLGRYQQVAEQRGHYESLLQELRERRSDEDLFLEGSDFNEAAAGLSERLSQMIGIQAEARIPDKCNMSRFEEVPGLPRYVTLLRGMCNGPAARPNDRPTSPPRWEPFGSDGWTCSWVTASRWCSPSCSSR